MQCPYCDKKMKVHNAHWIDPLVKCECNPYMMRMSKAKQIKEEKNE